MSVVTEEGEVWHLKQVYGGAPREDLVVRLFGNNIDPDRKHTAASFMEVSGYGYAPRMIVPADFSITTEGAKSEPVEWTFTGPLGWVYGYVVTGKDSGMSVWAHRLKEPRHVRVKGDSLTITPAVRIRSTSGE